MALTKRRRRWLSLAIIALALLGWWWYSQPKPLRLVARQVLAKGAFSALPARAMAAGVIWYDATHRTHHAARWDGTPLWTMGDVNVEYLVEASAISPDLRTVAYVDATRRMPCLRIWQDGRLRSTVPLPSPNCQPPVVDQAGGVWCFSGSQLLRVEGARLTARVTLPAGITVFTGQLSPDAGALVAVNPAGLTYYALQVANGAVRLRPIYTVPITLPRGRRVLDVNDKPWTMLSRDVLFLPGGTRCNARGIAAGADGWVYRHPDERHGLTHYQTVTSAVVQDTDHPAKARVLLPATGQYWPLPQQDSELTTATPDGRYVLAMPRWLSYGPVMKMLHPLATCWPWPNRLRDRLINSGSLAIYERPGRLRARAVSWSTIGNAWRLPVHNIPLDSMDLALTPDGHTLHAIVQYGAGKHTTLEILTYRW
ncbi:MAG: hypothetical protein ACYDBB_22100 [Armatimonadota bacterium]